MDDWGKELEETDLYSLSNRHVSCSLNDSVLKDSDLKSAAHIKRGGPTGGAFLSLHVPAVQSRPPQPPYGGTNQPASGFHQSAAFSHGSWGIWGFLKSYLSCGHQQGWDASLTIHSYKIDHNLNKLSNQDYLSNEVPTDVLVLKAKYMFGSV